ncbi:hypothetical protein CABS01_00177 [Colletotrichum abscissum]|uniref:uncharacterized protein n=1 Tax=Colletotrichum abscissum TaxID=1671311 RepID=UPI0027D4E0FB|nr:uncharacterized protein CABS01_00177 [Colletotrichum abscissum]KAK1525088.1 hypothetical protein CABS01_00177 [Colletotrichum abscissum]
MTINCLSLDPRREEVQGPPYTGVEPGHELDRPRRKEVQDYRIVKGIRKSSSLLATLLPWESSARMRQEQVRFRHIVSTHPIPSQPDFLAATPILPALVLRLKTKKAALRSPPP